MLSKSGRPPVKPSSTSPVASTTKKVGNPRTSYSRHSSCRFSISSALNTLRRGKSTSTSTNLSFTYSANSGVSSTAAFMRMQYPHQSEPVKLSSTALFSAAACCLAASKSVCHSAPMAGAMMAARPTVYSVCLIIPLYMPYFVPGFKLYFWQYADFFVCRGNAFLTDEILCFLPNFSFK